MNKTKDDDNNIKVTTVDGSYDLQMTRLRDFVSKIINRLVQHRIDTEQQESNNNNKNNRSSLVSDWKKMYSDEAFSLKLNLRSNIKCLLLKQISQLCKYRPR